MPRDSLLERILYKKRCSGKVERDGKVYLKYLKKRRFKFPQSNTIIIFMVMLALATLYLLVTNLIMRGK